MKTLILTLISVSLVNNVVLSQFLGLCPFLGVSKQTKTAMSMGGAVIFVITIASAVTHLLYRLLVLLHVEYLETVAFIFIIAANKIVAIVSPDSAPIKRMVQDAKDAGTAIDATCGRKTRAVLIMDSGHIILAAVQPETVAGRVDKDITQPVQIDE